MRSSYSTDCSAPRPSRHRSDRSKTHVPANLCNLFAKACSSYQLLYNDLVNHRSFRLGQYVLVSCQSYNDSNAVELGKIVMPCSTFKRLQSLRRCWTLSFWLLWKIMQLSPLWTACTSWHDWTTLRVCSLWQIEKILTLPLEGIRLHVLTLVDKQYSSYRPGQWARSGMTGRHCTSELNIVSYKKFTSA